MSTSIASVIREARELITPREKWTQGVLARHENGNAIGPMEDNAHCYCAVGAVARVSGSVEAKWNTIRFLTNFSGGITRFNDTHKHEEVLSLMDKAASAADAEVYA